jgi:hypothetical protein
MNSAIERVHRLLMAAPAALLLAAPALLAQADVDETDAFAPAHYARHERVQLAGPHPIEVMADLNPAAPVSTLAVVSLKYFNRDGQLKVGFVVDNGDVLPGKHEDIDKVVVKDQHVHRQDGSILHRPTVDLDLCIGHRLLPARVDLVERSAFTAPLVLGGPELKVLAGTIVDDQKPTDPDCPPLPAPIKPAATG